MLIGLFVLHVQLSGRVYGQFSRHLKGDDDDEADVVAAPTVDETDSVHSGTELRPVKKRECPAGE